LQNGRSIHRLARGLISTFIPFRAPTQSTSTIMERRGNFLVVLVIVVVLDLLVVVKSTTKDDDEYDYGKTREFPDRPRGRRRPRSVGGWKIDDEGR
jgi:hypothetical protein